MNGLILWVYLPCQKDWFEIAYIFETYAENFAELDDLIYRRVQFCTRYKITDENDEIIYIEAYRV